MFHSPKTNVSFFLLHVSFFHSSRTWAEFGCFPQKLLLTVQAPLLKQQNHLLEKKLQTDCQRQQQNSLNPNSYKEVKSLLKQKQKSVWRLKNNGFDPQKDQINTLDRRTQTTIFHLCTGHCGLRNHLKRLGLTDSAHCRCEQTLEHILQTSQHLEIVHQQFWPEDIEVGTMFRGQTHEQQRTSSFLAAIGLRI